MTNRSRKKSRLLQSRRAETVGRPPGSVVIDPASPSPIVHLTVFSPDELLETTVTDVDAIRPHLERNVVVWVNVAGLGDEATLRRLAEMFELHPLALEDVVNAHQRPKVDRFGEHLFITARMPRANRECATEQVGLFLGRNFVVTFLEDPGDCFEPVRRRLRTRDGMIRRRGADYLAYALLDSAVDAYFPMLEQFGDRLEEMEDEAIVKPTPALVARIHDAKRELRALRRIFWPLREAMNELVREPTHLVSEETRVYFRDLYDHTVQIIDLVETYRELGADLVDLYLSSLSNRMNEIMRVLTIIATIFMPLSFIVGIYGMNFDPEVGPLSMPELHWKYGYVAVWCVIGATVVGMLMFFHRKGWLGAQSPLADPEALARHWRKSQD